MHTYTHTQHAHTRGIREILNKLRIFYSLQSKNISNMISRSILHITEITK